MPDPLPSEVVARLRSDRTTALAAALIVAGSFPDLVSWAIRAFGGYSPSLGRSAERFKDAVSNGEVKANAAGRGKLVVRNRGHCANRGHTSRQAAAKHDEALLALMRANPGTRLTEIIRMNGRPRNSTVSSLKRLEKAGLVEHAERGKWTVVDPDLLEAAPPTPSGWIEPLSGKRVARHAADGRVRDQMTLA